MPTATFLARTPVDDAIVSSFDCSTPTPSLLPSKQSALPPPMEELRWRFRGGGEPGFETDVSVVNPIGKKAARSLKWKSCFCLSKVPPMLQQCPDPARRRFNSEGRAESAETLKFVPDPQSERFSENVEKRPTSKLTKVLRICEIPDAFFFSKSNFF